MPVRTLEVRTTPTRLLVANPERVVYTIINTSGTDVYVAFDKNVATSGRNAGILVASNGGVWSDEFHKGEVWAIASTTTNVVVVETTKGE